VDGGYYCAGKKKSWQYIRFVHGFVILKNKKKTSSIY
jgi:hypothetical protein